MFTRKEDNEYALTGGPWLIYDHYLTVRQWEPDFDPKPASINTVAAWLRIPHCPMEYYDEESLSFIGNSFGRTIKVDLKTATQARGLFARICLQLNLDKQLTPGLEFEDKYFTVEYEGLHLLCLECGRFGHHKDHCPHRKEFPTGKRKKKSSQARYVQKSQL